MKKLLLFMLGWVCISCLSAQTQTLRANLDKSTTVEMTVRMENDIAYVRRAAVPFDAAAKHGIHNLAGAKLGEGTIELPNDGGTYWLMSFDGQIQEINRPRLCFNCMCMYSGECEIRGPECYLGSCDMCLLVIFPCHLNPMHNQPLTQGSVALIKAKSIIQE